jgi:hypothetical protein
MQELHQREDQQLKGYGWVDAAKGTVRIPLETAIELMSDPKVAAGKGLVTREVKK